MGWIHLLVNNKVLDMAAKPIINTGPNSGWNEAASSKLSDVFPNQIRAKSQAIDLSVRGCFTPSLAMHNDVSYLGGKDLAETSPSVQRVNMSPEKHIAAIPMKNTNCETIARNDL
jgi:hypothetical protein